MVYYSGDKWEVVSMYKAEKDTVFVGISELRSKTREILRETKGNKVVLEVHHKPRVVLVPVEKYKIIEKLLELVEDEYFGEIAGKRLSQAGAEYLSAEEMEKLIGLK